MGMLIYSLPLPSISLIHNLDFRDSGVGDHGQDSINKYIKQHQCNKLCLSLGLPPIGIPTADQNGETDIENEDKEERAMGSEMTSELQKESEAGNLQCSSRRKVT